MSTNYTEQGIILLEGTTVEIKPDGGVKLTVEPREKADLPLVIETKPNILKVDFFSLTLST